MDVKNIPFKVEYYSPLPDVLDNCFIIIQNEKIVFANDAAADLLGYKKESLLEIDFCELIAPYHIDMFNEMYLLKGMEDKIHSFCELDLIKKENNIITTELSVTPILYKDIFALQIIITKTTEKKGLEEKQEELQYGLLSKINECIIVADKDFNILFWNNGAEKIFGWKPYEVINTKLTALFYLENLDFSMLLKTNNGYWEGKLDGVDTQNGEKKAVNLSLTTVNDENLNVKKIIAIVIDITEVVHSQQEARKANRAKSEFLANISHEMRTPLMGIMGFCEILSSESLNNQNVEHVITIQQCAEQLLELVNNMLDLSKIEAQQVEIRNKKFNLHQMIKTTIQYLRPLMQKKGLKSHIHISSNVPIMILGDEGKLKQVLTNIVCNAFKFTPEGEVNIYVSKHSREYANSLFPLKISVYDTGIGIDQEKCNEIFEPFIQAKKPKIKGYEGTGLGLTISKQLIELMGGYIWCKPNEPKGSVFSIVVPVKEITNVDMIAEHKKDYDVNKQEKTNIFKNGIKVLLAEDIKVNRKLISHMLSDLGYDVYAVANGEECVKATTKWKPDVILMDMQMPILDGYEATKVIRQNRELEYIPIIALTAYAMSGDIEKCMQAGCNSYLSKPFSKEQLHLTIRQSCSKIKTDIK
ncbi:hypothetical protein SYNTR_0142 [Candidatus Syntrophocurvum alkaliphilum]|uniref:Circadian input-output histidine kinase CikA n=1 Tax=Candidatus Syntrophocurvum alkaliphilum TaxID=2293317 RepID=A0A6I6DBC2_9FIRM|nr:PAS domain-containing hybrid sensor histidine kinase/response regulator [Candidatus Syntrophocurvum alkaliphilum]QGT98735.1 hypothetical protein SYNTR_0142 [Candidatus Syntrophocurvum alkaliphilum]